MSDSIGRYIFIRHNLDSGLSLPQNYFHLQKRLDKIMKFWRNSSLSHLNNNPPAVIKSDICLESEHDNFRAKNVLPQKSLQKRLKLCQWRFTVVIKRHGADVWSLQGMMIEIFIWFFKTLELLSLSLFVFHFWRENVIHHRGWWAPI